jgi:two-component system alkaline phosphatase synthesis response regulator PhoP
MKILFVDDSDEFRTLLKVWLNKTNYNYVISKSVVEAKEILLKQNFDLIVSDLLMPENSGIMMLELLRESKINTPIIIMSVLEADDYPILDYNIDNRFTKPTTCEGLVNIINVIVNKLKLLKKN